VGRQASTGGQAGTGASDDATATGSSVHAGRLRQPPPVPDPAVPDPAAPDVPASGPIGGVTAASRTAGPPPPAPSDVPAGPVSGSAAGSGSGSEGEPDGPVRRPQRRPDGPPPQTWSGEGS
jgi:hypothetical protein